MASTYDSSNNLISLGRHLAWKEYLINAAMSAPKEDGKPYKVLDLCCGTGDITYNIAKNYEDAYVVGVDFSNNMLDVAKSRCAGLKNVEFINADALKLPFKANEFDSAVISFGLRNLSDYKACLLEMKRVTKEEGIVCCLDSHSIDNRAISPAYKAYFKNIMPLLGGGKEHKEEYMWLFESTQNFLSIPELVELFNECGFVYIGIKTFMCGAAALITGENIKYESE
ncbi:MAG: ubiquinone/menaquinone biosynthesis methyltransferase [Coriobacteriales bacterium]|nr:ubiquinone/menaquinone biosynthesis methyltransferase [Coriobacteriales bacterium]